MNFSKFKISGAKLLLGIANYCDLHNNLFSKRLHSCLQYFIKKLTGLYLFKIKSIEEYCNSKHYIYEPLIKDRTGYSWTSSSNLNKESASCVCNPLMNLCLALIKDVCITSNSDLIIDKNNKLALNDYCANNNDANRTYVDGITLAYKGRSCLVKVSTQSENISAGIMLNGKFSFNYYHNIYENLIRFLLIEDFANKIPTDVPVIIDSEVLNFPSLKMIVDHYIEKTGRKFLTIRRNTLYTVSKLYYFSPINQLTPQHVDSSIEETDSYLFDISYTQKFANELLKLKSGKTFPDRIFLTRANVNKRNFNEEEVFEVLKPLGFERVAPETLPFEDQIQLFNNAKFIIGGSGAAFTNMLFSKEGCRAIIILGRGGTPSSCFNAPAFFNGAEISFYQCARDTKKGIHSNFSVNISDFKHFVENNVSPYCK